MYYAYVLRSEKNGYNYYGSTNDLERRLREHNSGHTKSVKYIRPLKLVYLEEFSTLSEARKREKFFKSGQGRAFVKSVLAEQSPEATGSGFDPHWVHTLTTSGERLIDSIAVH
jgi:putative endonuclease